MHRDVRGDEDTKAKRNIAYDDSSEGDALNNRELQDVLAKAAGIRNARIDVFGKDRDLLQMIAGPKFRISGLTNKILREGLQKTIWASGEK